MTSQPGRYPSPLRYPGGKGKVANYVKLLLLENDLVGTDYVEPYAGGASVALSLLFEDYADHVHINDINPGVHAFWDSVLNATEALVDRIQSTAVTMAEWHLQREVYGDPASAGLDLGFATFFLNRTNRSGIIGGGVIGGIDQTGPWKVDARFNKDELVRRIRKIGRYRTRVNLTNQDAADYLTGWSTTGAPAFIYLDPPYFVKGSGLYDNFYDASDHAAIAAAVAALPQPWMVSYDAHPEIIKLYPMKNHLRYSLSYSASATRGLGAEVMFFSEGISRPSQSPSGVPASLVAQTMLQSALF